MNALEVLNKLEHKENPSDFDQGEDDEVNRLINSLTQYMNDDFNTAMTMASLFELTSKINAWQNQQAKISAIKKETFDHLKQSVNVFVSDILGLKNETAAVSDSKMNDAMELLIALRNEARAKKDFATSDKIRNELMKAGIQLKDGKEGTAWEIN
jgi:cysteinyl-tRNA synthetase